MKKFNPANPSANSLDLVQENNAQYKVLFPQNAQSFRS